MAVKPVLTAARLALPKGILLSPTAELLRLVGMGFADYNSRTRIYRMASDTVPGLTAKMLNERDIPVQVAIGNYDFGICSSDWLQELQARYPTSRVHKLADLAYDSCGVYLACSVRDRFSAQSLADSDRTWRIVTEYPALAEAATCRMRLKKFRIFPLWGSASAYPPENAELAVLKAVNEDELKRMNLLPIQKICSSSACMIANTDSLETGNFSSIMSSFNELVRKSSFLVKGQTTKVVTRQKDTVYRPSEKKIWLALADGHQQVHTAGFIQGTGIKIDGYDKNDLQRRPVSSLDWINIKVIRPQDMPQQVANGNFDLAITGKDWLLDHLYQFPSSPVIELLDLNFGRVKIVAVVREDVPANSIDGIRDMISKGHMSPLRIATEYINIADKYVRDRHIQRYRVIPTWGATEVYLPEDADMLIENTETGQTLVRHRLKIIDTLFESTACLIGSRHSMANTYKCEKIRRLVNIFREAKAKK